MVDPVPQFPCYYFIGLTRRSIEKNLLRTVYTAALFHAHRLKKQVERLIIDQKLCQKLSPAFF